MKKMKVIQTELKNYNRRADESVTFRLDSLIELSSNEIAEVDSHRGSVAIVVLTDSLVGSEVDVDIDDILKNLPENDTIENYKSPSKRFRGVLWRLLEQKLGHKPTKEEFADYYKREYEKTINYYKGKFEDNFLEEEKNE
jgi:hypothetical protein